MHWWSFQHIFNKFISICSCANTVSLKSLFYPPGANFIDMFIEKNPNLMLFFPNQLEDSVLISHLDCLLSVFFLFNLSILHLRNQNCTPCSRYHCLLLPDTIACCEILLQDFKFHWNLSVMKGDSSYLDFPAHSFEFWFPFHNVIFHS